MQRHCLHHWKNSNSLCQLRSRLQPRSHQMNHLHHLKPEWQSPLPGSVEKNHSSRLLSHPEMQLHHPCSLNSCFPIPLPTKVEQYQIPLRESTTMRTYFPLWKNLQFYCLPWNNATSTSPVVPQSTWKHPCEYCHSLCSPHFIFQHQLTLIP